MNTQIKTWVGTVVILIMAITAGDFVWLAQKNQPEVSQSQVQVLTKKQNASTFGMANPASVFCEQNAGKLEIRTAEDGRQTGYCKFSDGSECEEWAYMRGECKAGDSLNATNNTSDLSSKALATEGWQTYRNEKYGFEINYPKDLRISEMGVQQIEGSYVAEIFKINPVAQIETEGFEIGITISADSKISDGPSDREIKVDKTINGVKFSGFSDPGMGDRYGYIAKHGNNFFLLDTVFDTGQFEQVLSTFKFIH
jgi:putative hemolysin